MSGWRFLVLLCVLAVGTRAGLGAVLLSGGSSQFVLTSDDGDAYDAIARWLALGTPIEMTARLAGKWQAETSLVDRWPIGYPLFLALQYRLLGTAYSPAVVLQALIAGGGAIGGYVLARTVLSERLARWAGLAQALSSTAIVMSAALYAEALYVPLLMCGLALLARSVLAGRGGWPGGLVAGVLLGLAEITRPLALPVFVAALAWTAWPGRQRSTRRLKITFALCGGLALVILPFALAEVASYGHVAVFTAGGGAALGDGSVQSSDLLDRILTLFVVGGWAPLGEPLISCCGDHGLLRLVEWILATVGCIWVLGRGRVGPAAYLLALVALAEVGPPLLIGLPLVRYRAPADPLFIIWMVAGLGVLWSVRPKRLARSPDPIAQLEAG